MAFSIRPATMADLDIVTEIEEKSFPPAEAASRERFEARMKAFGEAFLILEDDGKPVGLIDGMVTDREKIVDEMFADATLHNPNGAWQSVFGLCVIPEYRRQGGAALLMNAFIEKARREGRKGLILTCKDRLIHYYSKFGYESLGVSESVHGGAVWYDMILRF